MRGSSLPCPGSLRRQSSGADEVSSSLRAKKPATPMPARIATTTPISSPRRGPSPPSPPSGAAPDGPTGAARPRRRRRDRARRPTGPVAAGGGGENLRAPPAILRPLRREEVAAGHIGHGRNRTPRAPLIAPDPRRPLPRATRRVAGRPPIRRRGERRRDDVDRAGARQRRRRGPNVAPVVTTSSTSSTRRRRHVRVGPEQRARAGGPPGRGPSAARRPPSRSSSRRHGTPSWRATCRATSSAWSKPRSRRRRRLVGAHVTTSTRAPARRQPVDDEPGEVAGDGPPVAVLEAEQHVADPAGERGGDEHAVRAPGVGAADEGEAARPADRGAGRRRSRRSGS